MSGKKPSLLKKLKYKSMVLGRMLTSDQRKLPDFLIIGAAKGGTTSLFNYLIQHPQIHAPLKKEIHFFDAHHHKGIAWYKMHFPGKNEGSNNDANFLTGEATPYYLSHPLVPQRVKQLLPNVKLIVLLRNPVDRAFSNYQHMVRLGFEKETFEKALELESERVDLEIDKIKNSSNYYSFKHQHFSYVGRGKYAEELERWFLHFPKEQFLILNSENFYANPSQYYLNTLNFLHLQNIEPVKFTKFNVGDHEKMMHPDTRTKLSAYFKTHNDKLYQLLNTNYNW